MPLFDLIRRHPLWLISALGNVLLAVCLMVVWQARKDAVTQVVERSVGAKAATTSRFQWKDLDAPDFATFVKNLRAVGCPEATIRDIIRGELNEIYEVKREEMERELAAAPEIAREVMQQRLQSLTDEAAAALASLTGTSLASGANPEGRSPGAAEKKAEAMTAARQDSSVLTPAAFLVGNDASQAGGMTELSARPSDPTLDPVKAEVLGQIRDGFADSLTDAGTDTSSPIYRQRWHSAQRDSDEIYSSLFGGDAFVQTQIEAAREQQAQAK